MRPNLHWVWKTWTIWDRKFVLWYEQETACLFTLLSTAVALIWISLETCCFVFCFCLFLMHFEQKMICAPRAFFWIPGKMVAVCFQAKLGIAVQLSVQRWCELRNTLALQKNFHWQSNIRVGVHRACIFWKEHRKKAVTCMADVGKDLDSCWGARYCESTVAKFKGVRCFKLF